MLLRKHLYCSTIVHFPQRCAVELAGLTSHDSSDLVASMYVDAVTIDVFV